MWSFTYEIIVFEIKWCLQVVRVVYTMIDGLPYPHLSSDINVIIIMLLYNKQQQLLLSTC